MLQIVRRLRNRSPYKAAVSQPKFPNNLDYAWQFAGWGKFVYAEQDRTLANSHCRLSYLDLGPEDLEDAARRLADERNYPKLDQYRATSIAGNAVWGSVFYSYVHYRSPHAGFSSPFSRLPAICATANIYSTICMAVACSVLFLFRPILLELGDAIRVDGASVSIVLPLVEMLCNFRLV